MRIFISSLEEIIRHAREAAPIEACGYLSEKDGIVTSSFRLSNVDRSSDHFTMDPAEQFAAIREIRTRDEKLCAVYHSHPATPARPSQEDIRLAFDPSLVYVIVSLAGPDPAVNAFRIRQGTVTSEPVEIVSGKKD